MMLKPRLPGHCLATHLHCNMLNIHINSNKKVTSDFHGTVSINPVKMSQQKMKPKCLSNVGHAKIGNYLILSSYHEGLLDLMCPKLFPLSPGRKASKRDTFYVKW